MEHPAEEIEQVILTCTSAINPEVQKAAIEKYYAPDAEFHHPMCSVSSSATSRQRILGIYQWYRVMSPQLKVEVKGVTYNSSTNEVFAEVVQVFHIRWSPFRAAPSRLMVHLTLGPSVEDPNSQVIKIHEDFYHPEDFAALIIPPAAPLIRLLLWAGTSASNLNAHMFRALGFWATREDKPQKDA